MAILLKYFYKLSVFFFIILIVVFPFQFYEPKGILYLFFLIAFFIKTIKEKKIEVKKSIVYLFLAYSLHGFIWVLYGKYFNSAIEGSFIYVFPLYAIFPLVNLSFLMMIGRNNSLFNYILKCLEWSLYFCILYVFYLMASFVGAVPTIGWLAADEMSRANINTESTATIIYHGVTSLAFLSPFYLTKTLIKKDKLYIFVLRLFLVVLSIVAIFLTGRRAVILIVGLTPFIIGLFSLFLKPEKSLKLISLLTRRGLSLMVLFIFMSIPLIEFLDIDINNTFEDIGDALSLSSETKDVSMLIRARQAESLIDGILQKPILGHGHGTSSDYGRGKPWRYELSYLAYLYHTGIVGSLLLLFGVVWIFANLIKRMQKYPDKIYTSMPIAVGVISVLLAYSSNPYLDGLDVQWTFYIAVIYLNQNLK